MHASSLWHLEQKLERLPHDLNASYEKILACSEYPEDLKRLLQCLAYSMRDMTVEEIAEVVTINFPNRGSDLPAFKSTRRYEYADEVLNICYGLVVEFQGINEHLHKYCASG